MTLHSHSVAKTEYTFLAHPPPQKKRSKQPLYVESIPSQTNRRRSNTFSGIVAWASRVPPGSPASLSPHSPHRRPSFGKGCCSSLTSIHAASSSFLHLTPTSTTIHVTTPSVRDFKIDLTAVGYTSIFLQFPNTPISATLPFSIKSQSSNAAKGFPNPAIRSPSCKPRSLTRFRSLSVLRSRGRSKLVTHNSPTKMKAKDAAASAAIIKRKKSKYGTRPPTLANELALMQFADGGSMDSNINRIIETRAKATGTVCHGIYRDGLGGIWLDQDEELEYAHLLAEDDDSQLQHSQWVTFDSDTPPVATCIPEDERRESVSTQNSELNPNCMVQPVTLLGGDDLALFGNTLVPPVMHTPSLSVLGIPSRPNRAARHLQNPNFFVDVGFSHPRASPNIPESINWSSVDVKLKEKERKRPAPLKLSPPSPAFKLPVNLSDTTQLDVRTRLAGSSQAIHMPRQTQTANDGPTSLRMKTKQSVLNMKGLFQSGRKSHVVGN